VQAQVQADERASEVHAFDDAVSALCDSRIAMLGENGFHGDGRTSAFKSRLVRALVERCGFTVVAFESGAYDFIAIERAIRRGDDVSRDMVASAIGGLWNQNVEVQSLIDFLSGEAADGQIRLVGLDDQVGSRGAFYSLEAMPLELASYLDEGRRGSCAASLRQRIWSAYSTSSPYAEDTRRGLRACLDEIEAAVEDRSQDDEVEILRMIANFRRTLDGDFHSSAERQRSRDASMFANLVEIEHDGGPAAPKVIVWAANGHITRRPVPGSAFEGSANLGAHIGQRYGHDAYALGFTAAGGSYRYTVRTPREIPAAPPGSLEDLALAEIPAEESAAFRPAEWLEAQGSVAGAAFNDHQYSMNRWGDYYDGIVVFRAERPPERLDE
jgi:erythromycin esterase-like protein